MAMSTFNIRQTAHVAPADSKYVEGLQLAHMLAEVLADCAKGTVPEALVDVTRLFGVACLVGQPIPIGPGGRPPH